jgi:hypothetical protein
MSFDGSSRRSRHRPAQPEEYACAKVVLYALLSLDGVAEHPDEFFSDWDEAMDANLAGKES